MDADQLIHPVVKAAIDAMNAVDREAWLGLFAEDAILTDDGSERDCKQRSGNSESRWNRTRHGPCSQVTGASAAAADPPRIRRSRPRRGAPRTRGRGHRGMGTLR